MIYYAYRTKTYENNPPFIGCCPFLDEWPVCFLRTESCLIGSRKGPGLCRPAVVLHLADGWMAGASLVRCSYDIFRKFQKYIPKRNMEKMLKKLTLGFTWFHMVSLESLEHLASAGGFDHPAPGLSITPQWKINSPDERGAGKRLPSTSAQSVSFHV